MTDTDLATWLLEQVAADEQAIRGIAAGAWWVNDYVDEAGDAWLDRWANDRRARAECEAKRIRIELHGADRKRMGVPCKSCFYDDFGVHGLDRAGYPCDTLKAEALPYVDRPGYREEWA